MRKESLRQLYVDELKDLYSAETQLVKALPKMAKASSSAQLRQAFEEHLRQTSEQVSRLEQIFDLLEETAALSSNPLTVILERDGAFPSMDCLLTQTDLARMALARGRARRTEFQEVLA